LDSTRLAALERQALQEDRHALSASFSSRPLQSARDRPLQRLQQQQLPDTETLNLLVTVKDKLRNYLFSKVDDDDTCVDDLPTKSIERHAEESMYAKWCADSLKELVSDDEDNDDLTSPRTEEHDTVRRAGGGDKGDSSWMRASLSEDDMAVQMQAWQV